MPNYIFLKMNILLKAKRKIYKMRDVYNYINAYYNTQNKNYFQNLTTSTIMIIASIASSLKHRNLQNR